MPDFETWKNATAATVVITKRDRSGNEVHEIINGGRNFTLTRDERLLNMDRAATDDLDVFKNGMLVPVRLLEGDEDAVEIAANPNLMTDTDMQALFKGHWRTFEAKVTEIRNPLALGRLLEIAQEIDATVRQVKIIEDRLEEVGPKGYTEVTSHVHSSGPQVVTGNAVTPK